MAEKLTSQQLQAVTNRGGTLLVSAAAGSGKTKVLVDRLLRQLNETDLSGRLPDMSEFLIITYTKAAAAELRTKIAEKLSEKIAENPENKHMSKQMQHLYLTQISTVHGFCATLLREYAYKLKIPGDFRVADDGECREIRTSIMKTLLESAYADEERCPHFLHFADSQAGGRSDNSITDIVLQVYDRARCHRNPDIWLEKAVSVACDEDNELLNTPWGSRLRDDLFQFLDAYIQNLSSLKEQMELNSALKKPSIVLEHDINILRQLRSLKTWDNIHEADINFDRLVFPKKENKSELAEQIKACRDACKEGVRKKLANFSNDSSQIRKDMKICADAAQGLKELVLLFSEEYSRQKSRRHILDFSDLEHKTLELLYGSGIAELAESLRLPVPTAAAREIGARYREVMVDEYQDSNEVQDAIFSAITDKQNNCFMVGDVKQSIYQFRLADPSIFLRKYNSFPSAEEADGGQARKILLNANFRSGPEVISAVNDVFSSSMSREVGGLDYGSAEALNEGIPHAPLPGNPVEFYLLQSSESSNVHEAQFAASRIREMLDDANMVIRKGNETVRITPDDIVILLRSPAPVADIYQEALEAVGIRCAMDSGTDLLHTEEVATFISLLQTIANPHQDIPLLSCLANPVFGFTADDLAAVRVTDKNCCFYDALSKSPLPKAVDFRRILSILRKEAASQTLTDLLERCLQLTRLDSIYGAMPDGKIRRENLNSFFQMAADYEKSSLRYLDQFLSHIANMQQAGLSAGTGNSAGCVKIMSIHKSKGLEFPVVFLCNLSRNFNTDSQKQPVLCHKELGLGLTVADARNRIRYTSVQKAAIIAAMSSESLSEEMRVLYVAMTRAKDRLVMTMTMQHPENKLREMTLRIGAGGGKAVCKEAVCPGDWIMNTVLRRTEAGELHKIAGSHNSFSSVSDYPWLIKFIPNDADSSDQLHYTADILTRPSASKKTIDSLADALSFQYGHTAACITPSKRTASVRETSARNEEASEDAVSPYQVEHWHRPDFRKTFNKSTQYGTAFHKVMQFIQFSKCIDPASISDELRRLADVNLITADMASKISPDKIFAFFKQDPGRKLLHGVDYVREFKFSLLDDASKYSNELAGEKVLLQGVVDCAILEKDGITVIDFKTDHITSSDLTEAAERHRAQIDTYAKALSRIYRATIKAEYIYFYNAGRSVRLE